MPEHATLPLFPLSNVVLFPHLRVPLHIFEPRYRQMTEAALAGDRRIGMIAVLPDHGGAMLGDPPLFSIGCAGSIEDSKRLPDGRYNIVLHGTQRFRVESEQPTSDQRLYRLAQVSFLDDPFGTDDREQVARLREPVIERVDRVVRLLGREEGIGEGTFDGLDDPMFVNSLANGLHFSPREKQGLLEAEGIGARLQQLASLLDFFLAASGGQRTPDSGALH